MGLLSLTVVPRDIRKTDSFRKDGYIPGVIYGPDISSVSIAFPSQTFIKLYTTAGESSLVDVCIEGEQTPLKAVIQEVQHDPVSDRILHVDFRQINMKKEMHVPVNVQFSGESPAVKELGGTLVKALTTVTIKCLPEFLINHIDVPLHGLKTFDDVIRVKDLIVPAQVTILDTPETTIAKVVPPLTEEQIKAMEEQGPKSLEDIKVESVEKKKEEETKAAAEAETEASSKKE